MSTKHTPGPWQCKGQDGKFLETDWCADTSASRQTMFAPILDANGKTVALVVREDWNDAQIEADARLIAAASELLELALEVARVLESNHTAITDTVWVTDGSPETLLDMARAAIAKATGGQS